MPIPATQGVLAAEKRNQSVPTVLGYSSNGSTAVAMTDGGMFSSKFTLASAGHLAELHGWLDGGSGASFSAIVHIYSDSAGSPGSRLAYTSPFTVVGGGGGQSFGQTGFNVALAAGDYWLGACCSGNSGGGGQRCELTGGTHNRYLTGATFNPPPNPWGTSTGSGTRKYSMWAVVNVP